MSESVTPWALNMGEPMAEAMRRVLRDQFEVMLANEAGSRLGDDIEHVHEMRVAVRRMRVAFRLFGIYYQQGAIKQFRKDLREAGHMLGAVRDLDVFDREATRYLRRLSKPQRHHLDPLLNHWHTQRETARLALVEYLDGEQYRRFVQEFSNFVTTPGAGAKAIPEGEPARFRVCDVLSSTVWQLYETVRAYDRVIEGAPETTLHALRIDCKYLRYILEFFEGALGPDAPWLIQQVIALQDHLGGIQDAGVAQAILENFVAQTDANQVALSEAELAAVAAYRDYRLGEQRSLIANLPEAWRLVDSPRFRRRLSASLLPAKRSARKRTL